jgi:hypothetical protein
VSIAWPPTERSEKWEVRIEPPDGSPRANGPVNAPARVPRLRAHLRCETQPGASAHPLAAGRESAGERPCQRAGKGPVALCAPSVRNAAGGFRPSAEPPDGSPRANGPVNALAKGPWRCAHLRCETPPGASARPLSRRTGVRGRTALPTRWQRARGVVRTFGAKRSRGLPPIR